MSAVPIEFTADLPDRPGADRGASGDPASGRVRMPVPVPPTVPVPAGEPGLPDVPVAPGAPAEDRRVVAVALSAAALLRPDSDLARILRTVPRSDLLVATDEPRLTSVRIPAPPPVDIDDLPPVELDQFAAAELELELPTSVVIDDLGLPGLRVHRLDLDLPLPATAEDDLVAALSELIGFDPEPGVVCLAPEPVDGAGAVVSRAAQRVARVYGLPLLRFRSSELCAVVPAG
jgi:hypothetical protein